MDCLYSVVKLICYSRGSMVPQFLILHLYPDRPEAESEVLQEEVRHVGAADQIVWRCSLRCTLTRSGSLLSSGAISLLNWR